MGYSFIECQGEARGCYTMRLLQSSTGREEEEIFPSTQAGLRMH